MSSSLIPSCLEFFNRKLMCFTFYDPYFRTWYSYNTLIAFNYGGTTYVHDKSFSRTTSQHINYVLKDRSDHLKKDLGDEEFDEAFRKAYRSFRYGHRKPYWTAETKKKIHEECVEEITEQVSKTFTEIKMQEMREALHARTYEELKEMLRPVVEKELRQELRQAYYQQQAEEAEKELQQYYDLRRRSDRLIKRGQRKIRHTIIEKDDTKCSQV